MTNAPDPRRVEYLPVAELSANPHNPKAHADDTIDASIGRFGMLDPIVRDERTGYVISGHGRRKALAEREGRGETPPEGVKVAEDGTWLVPVVVGWASRTDTEASAALIALNRTTELGGWVDDELLGLLEQITESGDEEALLGVGFDESALDDLRVRLEEQGDDDFSDPWGNGTTQVQVEDLRQNYSEQGRRMVVLEYSLAEFPEIVARLGALRSDLDLTNNSEALANVLAERYPHVTAADADDLDEDPAPNDAAEHSDPAATLDK